MNALFKHAKSDRILLASFVGSAAAIAVSLLLIVFFYNQIPPFFPLFNQYVLEKRLGTKAQIYLPLIIGIAIYLVNFLLSQRLYEKAPLLSRILSLTSFLVSMFLLYFVVKTLQLIL